MPFTPAHPAIILPFLRSRYFSATGLVVGSMSPDFEYFFKMSVSSEHSHSIVGLFYFDLPVTLFIALIFHGVVKRNLIYNMPVFFQKRFQDLLNMDFVAYVKANLPVFLLSALLGAASHIFWDSFTHNGGYFVTTLPFYKGTHVPYGGVKYPLWYALQHISTIIGLTIVTIYLLAMAPQQMQVRSKPRLVYWLIILVIAGIVTWIRFFIFPLKSDIGNVVVSAISGLMIGLVCCGFINFKNTFLPQKA